MLPDDGMQDRAMPGMRYAEVLTRVLSGYVVRRRGWPEDRRFDANLTDEDRTATDWYVVTEEAAVAGHTFDDAVLWVARGGRARRPNWFPRLSIELGRDGLAWHGLVGEGEAPSAGGMFGSDRTATDWVLLPGDAEKAKEGAYEARGRALGALVDRKQREYGDSFHRSVRIIEVLWPDGIPPSAYQDALALIRVIDKLFRVAAGKIGDENPWRDIAGYSLLSADGD